MTASPRGAWSVAGLVAGALLLAWPALLNGYPLLFSDTGAFLHQTLGPLMIWDKPWVYGPLLHLAHWRITLWGPLAAQAVLTAWLIHLAVRAVRGRPAPGITVMACAAAAALTTAPFVVSLLMPDVFTATTVLAIFLLGPGRESLGRTEAIAVGLVATLGIAAHLSHLPLAGALVVLVLAWTRSLRSAARAALPLLGAVAILLVTNGVGHGRISLSPHGATFMLARLQADGLAGATLRAHCPQAGWYLCAFADRLPMDNDDFLWSPDSPVNRDAEGRPRFLGGAMLSGEAREIVARTFRERPLEVAAAMARNTLAQLGLNEGDDVLSPDHFGAAIRPRIAEGFPPHEGAAFEASLQARDLLAAAVAPILVPHRLVLAGALLLAPFALWRAGRSAAGALLACVLLGILANGFTGALSTPHDRYGARIAWLLPVAVALALLPDRRRTA